MQFQLTQSGTISECREALNTKIAESRSASDEDQRIVRAIASAIVTALDPLYEEWASDVNKATGAGMKSIPGEPTASFAIDCTVSVSTT